MVEHHTDKVKVAGSSPAGPTKTKNMKDIILFQFEIGGMNTLKDRSMSIKLNTPELSATKIAQIMEMRGKQGFAAFRLAEFTPDELRNLTEANLDLDLKKGKSQSERLRNVLFALFKHTDPIGTDFPEFYRQNMERVIDHFKSKLPEIDPR